MTASGETIALAGSGRRRLRPWFMHAVAALSGWLLLQWVILLGARYLFGYERKCELEFNGRRLRIKTVTRCFGRVVRNSDEFILAKDMLTVGVERRYPFLLTTAGLIGLVAGTWVGVGWVFDGLQANYLAIAFAGLGLLGSGLVLDILFGALSDYVGGRDSLLITLGRGRALWMNRGIRITGIEHEQARQFMSRLVQLAP